MSGRAGAPGADIIALRKVGIESTDYAQCEYGATAGQAQALDRATTARHRRLERSKRLTTVTAADLRTPESLFVSFLGDHDAVTALLRCGTYR